MKCRKCGNEFQGNFCPNCGEKAEIENGANEREAEQKISIDNNPVSEEKKYPKQQGHNKIINNIDLILEVLFTIVITVLLFHYQCSVLLIVGLWLVEFAYIVLWKKKQKTVHTIVTVIGVIIVLLSIYNIYNGYQNEKYVTLVQNHQFMDVSYEKLFDNFSNDVKWECTKHERFTTIDPSESDRSGSFEAVVTVSGSCHIYNELTTYTLQFNVSKDNDLAVPMNLQCYGTNYSSSDDINRFLYSTYRYYMGYANESQNNILYNEPETYANSSMNNSENSDCSTNQESSSNTEENKSGNAGSKIDTSWFLDYDSFYHVRAADDLSIYSQNDVYLFVTFYGFNGENTNWLLNIEPDKIGSDGELIYCDGNDFTLSYYPSDHHIYIISSNDKYAGEYYPN